MNQPSHCHRERQARVIAICSSSACLPACLDDLGQGLLAEAANTAESIRKKKKPEDKNKTHSRPPSTRGTGQMMPPPHPRVITVANSTALPDLEGKTGFGRVTHADFVLFHFLLASLKTRILKKSSCCSKGMIGELLDWGRGFSAHDSPPPPQNTISCPHSHMRAHTICHCTCEQSLTIKLCASTYWSPAVS